MFKSIVYNKYVTQNSCLYEKKKNTWYKNALFNTKRALNPNLSPSQPRALQCPSEFRTDKKLRDVTFPSWLND